MNKYLMQRGWMDMPIFADEPFTEREAFSWMIENAAWKSCRVRCGNCLVNLDRGQLAYSERFLAVRWSWHSSRVHRFLARLKSEALIGADSGQGVNIITICNYSELQDFDSEEVWKNEAQTEAAPKQERSSTEAAPKQIRTPDNTGITPENTISIDQAPNALAGKKTKTQTLTTMPENWRPNDAHRAKCRELGFDADQLVEEFTNHHLSKASKFADWDRAFFTWIGNAQKFNGNKTGRGSNQSTNPSIGAVGIRLADRYRRDDEQRLRGNGLQDQPQGQSF